MRQRRTETGERAEVLRHARRRDRALTDRLEKARAPLTDRARRHYVLARVDDAGRLVFAALARITAFAEAEKTGNCLNHGRDHAKKGRSDRLKYAADVFENITQR